MTLKQLIDYLDETYDVSPPSMIGFDGWMKLIAIIMPMIVQVDLVMLSAGVTIVFSAMIPAKKANERKAMKVKELVESVCKKVFRIYVYTPSFTFRSLFTFSRRSLPLRSI